MQPVARGKEAQLRRRKLATIELQLPYRRHHPIANLRRVGNNATLCERDCAGFKVIGHAILHIHADADGNPCQGLALPTRFTQHPAQLPASK